MSFFINFTFFLCVIFSLYLFLTRKFVSPYHFVIKFGKPGCGKTTDMAKTAKYYLKKGYHVYSNVELLIPGVRFYDTKNFGMWTDENSVILLDEVNLWFDNRSFKNTSKQAVDYTRLFRHNKTIIICYSQTFDMEKKFRDIADEMWLMYKFARVFTYSKKIKKVLTIRQAQYSQDADSQVVDNLEFYSFFSPGSRRLTFNPPYFKYFDSFSKPVATLPLPYVEYKTPVSDPE